MRYSECSGAACRGTEELYSNDWLSDEQRTLQKFPLFPAVTAAERAAYRREIQNFTMYSTHHCNLLCVLLFSIRKRKKKGFFFWDKRRVGCKKPLNEDIDIHHQIN